MPATRTAPNAHPHAFRGLDDWIEVFRAGKHVDSKGRECEFSVADLDQMVTNVAAHKPPAVLGHPKHNDPAYGWGALKREGDTLLAKFDDVNPEFAAGVESGAYRNRSVSIINDKDRGWLVSHIGWLGASRPALLGLAPVEFEAEADTHDFGADDLTASYALGDVASALRSLREWLISKDGLDVADKVLSSWLIHSVASAATRMREQTLAEAETSPSFTAPGDPSMSLTPADLERVRQETEARVRAELHASQNADFTASQARVIALETQLVQQRIKGQVDGLVASGHVTPAEAAGLSEFLAAVDGGAEFQFTAPGQAEVTVTPADWVLSFISARQPLVKLGARNDDPPAADALNTADARAIADRAREFQAAEAKAGRHVSIDVAVTHVMSQAPKA